MQRSQSTFKITILGSGKRGLYRLSGILNIWNHSGSETR
jgi:hypothetical protein